MSLTSGSRLGLYEILSPLGAAGIGKVYVAQDRKLSPPAAIDLLPPELAKPHESHVFAER